MSYFLALLVDGMLAGAVYALVGIAFVLVYQASRAINFSVGEWVMFGARLTAAGAHLLGLGLVGGLAFGTAGMAALAMGFNAAVLRRLAGRPVIAVVMLTLGLGVSMRGAAALLFHGLPADIPFPYPMAPLPLGELMLPPERLLAGSAAVGCIVLVHRFMRSSRTGVALRAIADDQQAAQAMGIDVFRHLAIVWAMAGAICVVGGALWSWIGGAGFGLTLVALKVLPVVVIGGLDSIPGAIVGALFVGLLDSLAAGYLDAYLGSGSGGIAANLALVAVLLLRPNGLLGRPPPRRV